MSSLKDRWKSALAKLRGKPTGGVIAPEKWADHMLDAMRHNITLMGVDMAQGMKPEPVCPITKALIVQQLSDLSIKHPNVSIRELLSVAMMDGVKDDYELAKNLEDIVNGKVNFEDKAGTEITIRTKRFERKMLDPATEALRAMVDNMALANIRGQAAVKITPARLDGCSDPADTTGSGDVK